MGFRPRRPRPRPQNEDGDRRLSAAEEDDGFDCYKPTEEEKEALCHAVLFEDEKDPNILLDAKPAESMVQPAGDLQHEVKIEEESDVEGSYELPLNAADLLAEPAAQNETFDCYNFPEEERTPFDEDRLFEDVKRPDILFETNSTDAIPQGFTNLQNKVKIEDKWEDDGFWREALRTAAELTDHEDMKEKEGSLNEKQAKMEICDGDDEEVVDDGFWSKALLTAVELRDPEHLKEEERYSNEKQVKMEIFNEDESEDDRFRREALLTAAELTDHENMAEKEDYFYEKQVKMEICNGDDEELENDGFWREAFLHSSEIRDNEDLKELESCSNKAEVNMEFGGGDDVEEDNLLCHTEKKPFRVSRDNKITVKMEYESEDDESQGKAALNTADFFDFDEDEHPVGRLLFTCLLKNCPYSFKTFKEIEEHMEIHSDEEDFFCDACKKTFSSKDDVLAHLQGREMKKCCACETKQTSCAHLVLHLRVHTGERPLLCKTCGKGYARQAHLNIHLLTHTGEKAFVCGLCKKGFALKHQLETHKRIHTGEKPFKCKHCDFKCSGQSAMIRHNRRHTGEKPYSCGVCGRRFTQSAAFRWHEMTHSGVKPHECEHCGKRFKDRSSMNKHIRIHSGERPYSCKKCDKNYTDNSSLIRHTKRKHPS